MSMYTPSPLANSYYLPNLLINGTARMYIPELADVCSKLHDDCNSNKALNDNVSIAYLLLL